MTALSTKVKRFGKTVLIVLAVGILGCFLYLSYQKNLVREEFRIATPNGIESLERIVLGGTEQWISVRGHSRDNPILLYLHGGPGGGSLPLFRHIHSELEDEFTVVTWDQLGAGKSFSRHIAPSAMTIDRFVGYIYELVQHLRMEFSQERVFLLGHSWGSVIGIKAVNRYPELFHAFIGVGQGVYFSAGEKISYEFAFSQAEEDRNGEAIEELQHIGLPPFSGEVIDKILIKQKWVNYYGGGFFDQSLRAAHNRNAKRVLLYAPEYSLLDFFRLRDGSLFSIEALWDELMLVNLVEDIPQVQVPVYFLAGVMDYVTPFELVEEYFELLGAPSKELIWFENSGHNPHLEEPEKFREVLLTVKKGS